MESLELLKDAFGNNHAFVKALIVFSVLLFVVKQLQDFFYKTPWGQSLGKFIVTHAKIAWNPTYLESQSIRDSLRDSSPYANEVG